MYGEKFYQLHAAQRQLLRPLNNLQKTDPSEIEGTNNIRKQPKDHFSCIMESDIAQLAILIP